MNPEHQAFQNLEVFLNNNEYLEYKKQRKDLIHAAIASFFEDHPEVDRLYYSRENTTLYGYNVSNEVIYWWVGKETKLSKCMRIFQELLNNLDCPYFRTNKLGECSHEL